jgi:hypothetical protein
VPVNSAPRRLAQEFVSIAMDALEVRTPWLDALSRRQRCSCGAYQKLNPTILMMKSAEDRPSNELAKPLGRPTARRILVQRQVRSAFVVIAGVGLSDPAQMALAEDRRDSRCTARIRQSDYGQAIQTGPADCHAVR